MRKHNRANQRRQFGHGEFRIAITMPGVNLNPAVDPGLLALGRFDHAQLEPGLFVGMHWHRNDEILSLPLVGGQMLHRDTEGHEVPIGPQHLMLMNAGTGIQHEERIPREPGAQGLQMLQIFLRPTQAGLAPRVQFAEVSPRRDAWRLVAAQSEAPLELRSPAAVYDLHQPGGGPTAFPQSPFPHTTWLVYVVAGGATDGDGSVFEAGDSLVTDESALNWTLASDTRLVAFALDLDGTYTREGMFSGMR